MAQKSWREEFKKAEAAFLSVKDDYAQLAQAIGSPCDAWFGDPLESHAEVLARAKAFTAIALAQAKQPNPRFNQETECQRCHDPMQILWSYCPSCGWRKPYEWEALAESQ